MEDYNDLISSIVMGAVLVGIIIPLAMFLKHIRKEKDRLDRSGL